MTDEQLAHIKVLESSILYARRICNVAKGENSLMIADLMDAIHDTPAYLATMYCPSQEYIAMHYAAFDNKYPQSLSLIQTYYAALGSR